MRFTWQIKSNLQIRVLVVDDEPDVRDAYRQILLETEVSQDIAGVSRIARTTVREGRSPAGAAG